MQADTLVMQPPPETPKKKKRKHASSDEAVPDEILVASSPEHVKAAWAYKTLKQCMHAILRVSLYTLKEELISPAGDRTTSAPVDPSEQNLLRTSMRASLRRTEGFGRGRGKGKGSKKRAAKPAGRGRGGRNKQVLKSASSKKGAMKKPAAHATTDDWHEWDGQWWGDGDEWDEEWAAWEHTKDKKACKPKAKAKSKSKTCSPKAKATPKSPKANKGHRKGKKQGEAGCKKACREQASQPISKVPPQAQSRGQWLQRRRPRLRLQQLPLGGDWVRNVREKHVPGQALERDRRSGWILLAGPGHGVIKI